MKISIVISTLLSGGAERNACMLANYFAKKNGLKIVGEWWFGTDIPDLFRSLLVSANFVNKKIYSDEINKIFKNTIDQLQSVLDKNKTCSEIHMIFKKK